MVHLGVLSKKALEPILGFGFWLRELEGIRLRIPGSLNNGWCQKAGAILYLGISITLQRRQTRRRKLSLKKQQSFQPRGGVV